MFFVKHIHTKKTMASVLINTKLLNRKLLKQIIYLIMLSKFVDIKFFIRLEKDVLMILT